ncbi:unnamed protein product [Paramecium primaurelia]|uniref:Uncharacterized protein n=1 Tax=Paramecium primaurelia TaxID=5886 RepID=A0A8S1MNM4_PARPR|nr:unnamed protein product [Paramecium primaurelia]
MTTKKIHINILQTTNDLPTKRKIETVKQSKQKYNNQKPKVSDFNDYGQQKKRDWKEYYEKQLLELKSLYPNSTHNELTSIISKKWKKAKKNFQYFDQLAQQIKKEHINKESDQILNLDDNLQIIQNNKESDQFKDKLRSSSLKLIFCNQVFEIKGQLIIDAINQNRLIIYLNNQKDNQNTKQEDTNKCLLSIKDIQEQNTESQEDDNDNFQIVNNIKNYL